MICRQLVSITILAVWCMLSGVNIVCADPPCRTEIRKEKSAKRAYKWQQAEVTALTWLLVGLRMRREIADEQFQWHKVIELDKQMARTISNNLPTQKTSPRSTLSLQAFIHRQMVLVETW